VPVFDKGWRRTGGGGKDKRRRNMKESRKEGEKED